MQEREPNSGHLPSSYTDGDDDGNTEAPTAQRVCVRDDPVFQEKRLTVAGPTGHSASIRVVYADGNTGYAERQPGGKITYTMRGHGRTGETNALDVCATFAMFLNKDGGTWNQIKDVTGDSERV